MSVILSIIAFIVIFSVLVLVHELGHFFAALLSGVSVKEFGLGMPPKFKKLFRWKGADFTLNYIPFGGFVRMKGQDDFDVTLADSDSNDPDSFEKAHLFKRIFIVCAGVMMNFILAFVILFCAFKISFSPLYVVPDTLVNFNSFIVMRSSYAREMGFLVPNPEAPKSGILIQDIVPDSLAEKEGFKKYDIILQTENTKISNVDDFFTAISDKTAINFRILREGKTLALSINRQEAIDKLGIYLASSELVVSQKFSFADSLKYSTREFLVQAKVTVFLFAQMIKSILTSGSLGSDVTGPVGIAQLTYTFTKEGLGALLIFTAMLSMSLGIINILPLPALDGGRFIFMIFEGLLGRRISRVMEESIHRIGFILLMLLIVAITYKDVMRLFGG